jgi:lactate dehydrogenase-like 2-hydroxyacid dehydrogenase
MLCSPEHNNRLYLAMSKPVWITARAFPAPLTRGFARFPTSLGLIANMGVGTDNIDPNAAAARNIQVSNTRVVANIRQFLDSGRPLDPCW